MKFVAFLFGDVALSEPVIVSSDHILGQLFKFVQVNSYRQFVKLRSYQLLYKPYLKPKSF
ncbi:hypothetical protein EV194_101275 [Natronoflexus pectinivorans]|uniref:Uncharacterized protein n=1 Tax=Natronoflexus pectinivorans TaxID=682526 RepID=A0A4R2GMX1_9BACT|nr:hypothetical protein EV194_101275 [Natronoflexus pectinivorans]